MFPCVRPATKFTAVTAYSLKHIAKSYLQTWVNYTWQNSIKLQ